MKPIQALYLKAACPCRDAKALMQAEPTADVMGEFGEF